MSSIAEATPSAAEPMAANIHQNVGRNFEIARTS